AVRGAAENLVVTVLVSARQFTDRRFVRPGPIFPAVDAFQMGVDCGRSADVAEPRHRLQLFQELIGRPGFTSDAAHSQNPPAHQSTAGGRRQSRSPCSPLPSRALVSTQVSDCERAVEKSNSFPLDGGRLGWGWERQSTLAPPPGPSPTTGGGR